MSDELKSGEQARRRCKEARPAQLLAAALETFVERGFAGTRLEDIATRAGVSKGTLYLYFDSKDALFKAVIQEGMLPVLDDAETMYRNGQDDPEKLLRDLLRGWWNRVLSTSLGGVPKLIISEARNFPEVAQYYFDNVIARGRALIQGALALGMERGVFRQGNLSTLCHLAMSPLIMASIWRQTLACCEPEGFCAQEFVEAHLDLFLRGLRLAPHEE